VARQQRIDGCLHKPINITMNREYQGFIFTKHALERSNTRSVTQDMIVKVLRNPEITQPTSKPNTTKFIATVHGRLVHVVATYLSDQDRWLVVSVWVRGEEDQNPLVWRLLVLPFKAVWYVIKKLLIHKR